MTSSNSILFSEGKKVVKYNSKDDNFEWVIEFSHKICGLSRVDNYVFVTTYSNWGKNYTSLLSFETGEKFWEIQNVFYSIHIIEILLFFWIKTNFLMVLILKLEPKNSR